MTEINDYLTGEIIVDYADGPVTRREALRRLTKFTDPAQAVNWTSGSTPARPRCRRPS